jgi:RNA polymerase sigma factor (sigma-70 family)
MSFQPLPDHVLNARSDDDLIAYIRDARDAGELEAGRQALAILVFGNLSNVERRIRAKLPTHAPTEDLAHDALVRAIGAAFDGSSVGEFRSWLNTIVKRTIADYYRTQSRRPDETTLVSEHLGEGEVWGEEPGVESEAGAVEVQIVTDEVLISVSDAHRLVIELHVFADLTAPDVCDRIEGMSEANVAQIASRFRKKLRERLEADGGERP